MGIGIVIGIIVKLIALVFSICAGLHQKGMLIPVCIITIGLFIGGLLGCVVKSEMI